MGTAGILTLCALVTVGCSPSYVPISQVPRPFGKTFLGAGSATECTNQCWTKTVPIVRAELGLDPDALGKYDIGRHKELLQALQGECKPTGGVLRRVALPSLLDGLKEGPRTHAVLVDKNGHLYFLLGTAAEEGQMLCQFIHGDSSVLILSKDELLGAGFQEAWELGDRRDGPVPIRVGSGALTINEIIHNFGLLKPYQKVDCTFVFKNVGNVPLVIGKPISSCACTTTAVVEPIKLGPGETLDFPVTVHVSDTISVRQFVQLQISEGDSYASRTVLLELLASEIGSMKITPRMLEFGTIIPGHPYSQTFTLEEVTTDRFAVKKVDPGKIPLVHEMGVTEDHHGLRTYRFRCTLRADESTMGRHDETLSITTDSRFQPNVSIPITYEVAPSVTAVPSVVALGEMPVGEPRSQQVRFTSRTGDPLKVEIENAPAEATIQIDNKQNEPVLTLTVTLTRPGIWQGVIKGKVQTRAHSNAIEIPCAAFGKAR